MSSEQFNSVEGIFWLVLGVTSFICAIYIHQRYKKLALFLGVVFSTFGASDFLQVAYGSFFQPGLGWLFLWKILDVIGMVCALFWYIRLRSR